MARGADRGDHHDAVILEPRDQVLLGCQREGGDLDPVPDQQFTAVQRVAGVGAQVDAEGRIRTVLDLDDRLLEFGQRHGRRRQNAQTSGASGAGDQARAGHPAHAGLHDRVLDPDELGERSTQHLLDHWFGTSRSRRPFGSSISRINMSSPTDGSRVVGTSPSTWISNADAAWTSSTLTPGCSDSSRTVWSGPPTSYTAR